MRWTRAAREDEGVRTNDAADCGRAARTGTRSIACLNGGRENAGAGAAPRGDDGSSSSQSMQPQEQPAAQPHSCDGASRKARRGSSPGEVVGLRGGCGVSRSAAGVVQLRNGAPWAQRLLFALAGCCRCGRPRVQKGVQVPEVVARRGRHGRSHVRDVWGRQRARSWLEGSAGHTGMALCCRNPAGQEQRQSRSAGGSSLTQMTWRWLGPGRGLRGAPGPPGAMPPTSPRLPGD